MGRFTADQADKFGGTGGGGYFSLKNDKDVARVRFMYRGMDDVVGYACHQVEIDGKKRYVNCLRDYNDPVDSCPMCAAHQFQVAKLFIPLYNVDSDRIETWERGKKFFSKISSICSRYSNLVSHTFEIERNGKAGDTATTYEIYEVGQDDTTMDDLPEVPPVIGGLVLDKTADEMQYYLDNGEFPSDSQPVTRRNVGNDSQPVTRRTPASTSRRPEDRF